MSTNYNIYFTSDNHWGHTSIISHCQRPFKDVHEMNSAMTDRWNAKVPPNGIVYHLGDFAFRCKTPEVYRQKLNGKIHLIRGNHDIDMKYTSWMFETIQDVLRLKTYGKDIFLSHYGHRVWPKSHKGSYHLFGHSHGGLPDHGLSFDVGVDRWNFTPLSLEEVIQIMEQKQKEQNNAQNQIGGRTGENSSETTSGQHGAAEQVE